MLRRPTIRAPKPLSLRIRLSMMMTAVFLAGMVALYVAARSSAEAAANRSFDRLLLGSVLSIAETLSVANEQVHVDLPYAALDMLSAAPDDRVFYRVVGPSGELVTGSPDLPGPPPRLAIEPQFERNAATDPRFFDARYSGEPVRFAVLGRQLARPGGTGWLWVQVGHTRRARNALENELVLNALAPIVAMTILALGVAWFGVGRALMPLRRIGEELEARQASDLRPITAPVPAEVAPVVESLNEFMARLEANIEALRAFIAEAAHQMRTPLAALLAQAQVAASGTDDDRRQGLKAVERNGRRLSRLLNQLLSDATVSHRSDVRAFETFDLLRTTRLAVKESVPMALGGDVRVASSLRSAPFSGDALMIGEAIKNVVDNAFSHGDAADRGLEVSLEVRETTYVIAIADRGDGLGQTDREQIFERFERAGSPSPGAGLGLGIVRRAIRSHGGDVILIDRDGGGLIVELHLARTGP